MNVFLFKHSVAATTKFNLLWNIWSQLWFWKYNYWIIVLWNLSLSGAVNKNSAEKYCSKKNQVKPVSSGAFHNYLGQFAISLKKWVGKYIVQQSRNNTKNWDSIITTYIIKRLQKSRENLFVHVSRLKTKLNAALQ